MRTPKHHPSMAQQAPTLTDILIFLQILSLFSNWIRNGAGRFLDILIALFSL